MRDQPVMPSLDDDSHIPELNERPHLVVVFPETCCSLADHLLGHDYAGELRSRLIASLNGWRGAVTVIAGNDT